MGPSPCRDELSARVQHANLSLVWSTDECPEGLAGVGMFSLGKILESEDWHGKAAGSVLKIALTVDERIQVELLISAERKRAPFLLQHGLVTWMERGWG